MSFEIYFVNTQYVQPGSLHAVLADLCTAGKASLLDAWFLLSDITPHDDPATARMLFDTEAGRFLELLNRALTAPPLTHAPSAGHDAALQTAFPLVYRVKPQLGLAEALVSCMAARGDATYAPQELLATLQHLLAALPLSPSIVTPYTERLAQLNHLSWQLSSLHNQDTILATALREGPTLVGAEGALIWLWDADQQAPVVMVSPDARLTTFDHPSSLVHLLQQACNSGGTFCTDAGESDESWPAPLRDHAVAFVPLPSGDACVGILTVPHVPGGCFSHDDLLLLSSLGNVLATALSNAQYFASERYLVNLLQSSIRQVVRATSGDPGKHDDFVRSLLQVAEGLTRAEAVCAYLVLDEVPTPLLVLSGALAAQHQEALQALTLHLADTPLPATGFLDAGDPTLPEPLRKRAYAISRLALDDRLSGFVLALATTPFSDDQLNFLHTVTEQIGVGIDNMRQAEKVRTLLFELSNVNYVTEAITSIFDPQRILSIITQAAGQALGAPIALAGWHEEDGTIHLFPGTAYGLPAALEREWRVTDNHAVVRAVLDTRRPVLSTAATPRQAQSFTILRKLHASSWACVPMVVKGRSRGIMLIADTRARAFSRREVALLSTYANQAALAMENSLLYEQIDRQLQQMEQLYTITRAVSSTLELPEILHELLSTATQALHVPAGLIALADDAGGVQRVVASLGITHEVNDLVFEPDEGIVGVACQRGMAISSSAIARDGRSPALRALARQESFASSMTVPLVARGHALGTLTIFSHAPVAFTASQEQMLRAMATEAAIAVQNARIFKRERARARQLDALVGEVSQRVTTSLDFLHALLQQAQQQDPASDTLNRLLLHIDSITAVHQHISDESPTVVDLKEAITQIASQRQLAYDQAVGPEIRVTGARLIMASRLATVLTLFIHEWLLTALAHGDHQPDALFTIAFQQVGRDVIVQLDRPYRNETPLPSLKYGIIDLTKEALGCVIREQIAGDFARTTLRFQLPDKS